MQTIILMFLLAVLTGTTLAVLSSAGHDLGLPTYLRVTLRGIFFRRARRFGRRPDYHRIAALEQELGLAASGRTCTRCGRIGEPQPEGKMQRCQYCGWWDSVLTPPDAGGISASEAAANLTAVLGGDTRSREQQALDGDLGLIEWSRTLKRRERAARQETLNALGALHHDASAAPVTMQVDFAEALAEIRRMGRDDLARDIAKFQEWQVAGGGSLLVARVTKDAAGRRWARIEFDYADPTYKGPRPPCSGSDSLIYKAPR